MKTSNFGEIRECKMPAQLMELAFHDDWKFYPDYVFMMDQIWRSTVAWGIYEGMCSYFGVPAKARLAAQRLLRSFPPGSSPGLPSTARSACRTSARPGAGVTSSMRLPRSMGHTPSGSWPLRPLTSSSRRGPRSRLEPDAMVYPGDTYAFNLATTAPARRKGFIQPHGRCSRMTPEAAPLAMSPSANVGVDGTSPVIIVASPVEGQLYGSSVAITFDVTDAVSGIASTQRDVNGTAVASGDVLTLASGACTLTINATDNAGNTATQTVNFNVDAGPPAIVSAVSRKTHGQAGNSDIDLPLDPVSAGVECRAGGPTTIVVTFNTPVVAADGTPDGTEVSLSGGTLGAVTILGNELTVSLSGSPDGACQTVTLSDTLTDPIGRPLTGARSIPIRVLLGDTNGDGDVSTTDVSQTRSQLGQMVNASTFRTDTNCNGLITIVDVSQVRSRLGKACSCQ